MFALLTIIGLSANNVLFTNVSGRCLSVVVHQIAHTEHADALNKRNLLKFMCQYDTQIQNRLEQLAGVLMSPDVQNELLQSASFLLLHKIKAEVCASPDTNYALMADEYKNVSKLELVAVCVGYVHAGKILKKIKSRVHGHK